MVSPYDDVDGFLTWTMFLPDHDVGPVVLNNMSGRRGRPVEGAGSHSTTGPPRRCSPRACLSGIGEQARAVDLKGVDPWLGFHEGGWSLVRAGREISLRIGPRVWPPQVKPDGSYAVCEGPFVTTTVKLAREADGTPHVELVGLRPSVGLPDSMCSFRGPWARDRSKAMSDGLSRRTVLRGLAGSVAAGGSLVPVSSARAKPLGALPSDWVAFDRSVQSAFDRMHLVGAAVAVVDGDRVVHVATFGDRSLAPRKKVTPSTLFNVASTTKSMSATLVAGYVDEGTLGWDQKVVDVWSGFRAPTDELTRGLRVRDLLGMDSGLGEHPAASVHLGEPTATQLLQSIASLPVVAAPNTTYVYNNTVFAVGGYLPLLATKVAPADLPAAYADAMKQRLFTPAAMRGSVIADDPRGRVDDYATGFGFDLRLKPQPLLPRFGSAAPTGGALSTLEDLAAYLRMQLRRGQSVSGARVVSAGNLTECWKAHVDSHVDHTLDPDAATAAYGMGWYHQTFTDGSSLVWHNGGIDGFTAFLGFLPDHDLGLVVLNNTGFAPNGNYFYTYVLNLLLGQRFGLNQGVTEKAVAASDADLGLLTTLGARTRPIDPRAVEPFLGIYEAGYAVTRTGRRLQIQIGPRTFPLEALADGSFVIGGGLIVTLPVRFLPEPDGIMHMELIGLETVRRTNGLAPS